MAILTCMYGSYTTKPTSMLEEGGYIRLKEEA